jgi:hypothetical protein
MPVVRRVITDDVHDGRLGTHRIVQIRQAVGQPRAQVQQCARGTVKHPGITISGARGCPLEESENTAHAVDAVQRVDKMHLRGPRIGETHLDAATDERPQQGLSASQDTTVSRCVSRGDTSNKRHAKSSWSAFPRAPNTDIRYLKLIAGIAIGPNEVAGAVSLAPPGILYHLAVRFEFIV